MTVRVDRSEPELIQDVRADVSRYMAWAKNSSGAKWNLAVSGVQDYPLAELDARIEDLAIGPGSPYGYKPLMERLAAKTGAPESNIVYTLGTSMANFIAFSALVERGDEVLVETPTYDPMLAILHHVGAKIERFERRPDKGFRIGLGEMERRIGPKTKMIVLCNLHNPSSAFTDDDTLRQIGNMAQKVGAKVFVDEVYAETLFDREWRSAFHLGDNFVVTSSLTKAYGLSGIRCGWILAPQELCRRMWQIVDITYGVPAHPAERLGVVALDHLAKVRAHAKSLLDTNRAIVNEMLMARPEIDCEPSVQGTTIFPRLKRGKVMDLVTILRTEYETSVVPGEFFEQPQHFRLGFCGTTETVREGVARVARALEKFKA